MIKITIETETPSDIRALIDSFMNNNHSNGCKHRKTHDEQFVCERGAGPVVLTPTKTEIIAVPDTSNITLTCSSPCTIPANQQEIPFETVKKVLDMPKTTISTCNEPETKTKQKVKIADALKAAPKSSTIPADTWTQEELNLLRTCSTADDAKFVYHSHYGNKRNDTGIYVKWGRVNRAGDVFRIGDSVKVETYGDRIATIQSFTDNRQCANVLFADDVATYQIGIEKLEKRRMQ